MEVDSAANHVENMLIVFRVKVTGLIIQLSYFCQIAKWGRATAGMGIGAMSMEAA